jgi:hypothetical protein
MTYTDHTGQPFDLAAEGDDVPLGWTVGWWGETAAPVFVWHTGTMMIPASDLQPEWGSNGQPSGRWIDAETGATAVDGPVPDGTYGLDAELLDSDTGELVWSSATPQQWWASQATDEGHILIDADGDVTTPGTWAAAQPGVRKVCVIR